MHSHTATQNPKLPQNGVLILVVMEDALALSEEVADHKFAHHVLILVLMEDALAH